ncbi:hypothetical protein FRX31_018869 [Thalictrum thalictroides]|uniref:Uncharacterized protein n=1 Tax=Thalictrum thalictroides TaxID=46969 RepID=A0A7J6W2F0_THATH|nr:hypothetical protein FRX31_018869 [Thalictrum thalictroides]
MVVCPTIHWEYVVGTRNCLYVHNFSGVDARTQNQSRIHRSMEESTQHCNVVYLFNSLPCPQFIFSERRNQNMLIKIWQSIVFSEFSRRTG